MSRGMKKSLCLFLALLVLGSACLAGAHCVINEKRDKVELTEHVVYGSPAAAEGLELKLHVTCNDRLFWDTAHTLGSDPETRTEFSFYQAQKREEYEFEYGGMTVDIGSYFGMGFGGDAGADDEILSEFHGYESVIKDVLSRAQPGEEHTEKVFLSDYMDYYPINFVMDTDAFISEGEDGYAFMTGDLRADFPELDQWLNDYFRIPVDERYAVTVTVLKTEDGNIREIDMAQDDDYWLSISNPSVITEDACYFALSIEDPDGSKLDASLIPGGFGVYRIPFSRKEEDGDEVKTAEIRELENVYSISENEGIRDMKLSSDGEDVLLVTTEKDRSVLTVLDAETAEKKQRLDIAETDWPSLYYHDGFVAACSEERLVLMEKAPDGTYRRALDVDISGEDFIDGMNWRSYDMAWNGERLAIAVSRYVQKECYDGGSGQYYIASDETCGCWLAVYDAAGLLYCTDITSSLTGGFELSYDKKTRFTRSDPVEVEWK